MSKLPSFQFYPADWRKDPGVQALSFHDRGVWFEILCLLHESEDRGKLLLNAHAMPDDALARLLGLDKQVLTNTLTTLLTYGVASRDPVTGALMNRRMVRDEEIRKIRQECGKRGGNPRLLNQNNNQTETTQDKQNPTPSSSSSTSVNKTPPSRGRETFAPSNWPDALKDAWREWEEHLDEKQVTMTQKQRREQQLACERAGVPNAIRVIKETIAAGGKYLYWDRLDKQQSQSNKPGEHKTEAQRDFERTGLKQKFNIPML